MSARASSSSPQAMRDMESGNLQPRPSAAAADAAAPFIPEIPAHLSSHVPPYVRFLYADDFDPLPSPRSASTPPSGLVPPNDLMQPICPYAGNREKLKEWARRPELVRDISSPAIVASPTPANTERWRLFAASTGFRPPAYTPHDLSAPPPTNFDQPWRGASHPRPRPKRTNPYLKSPWIVLALRLAVLLFACLCVWISVYLGSSASKARATSEAAAETCRTPPAPVVTLVISVVSIAYTIIFLLDHFLSPPIGYRSPLAKTALLLIDLFFIVLNSINIGYALSTFFQGDWACSAQGDPRCWVNPALCPWLKAFVGVLVVGEFAWLWAHVNSILKVVYRMAKRV